MWLVIAIGCATTPGSSSEPSDTTHHTGHTGGPRACDLPLEACLAAGCETFDATPHAVTDGCATATGPREPVGCWPAGEVCGEVTTWGRRPDDPEGTCWWFPTDCQPEGWVPCEPYAPHTGCP